jgi:hypothetical protein
MAQVPGLVSFTILDYYGSSGSVPIYVAIDTAQTVAQMLTFLDAQQALLVPLTEGEITEGRFELLKTYNVPAPVTDHAAEIERGGLFNFEQNGAPRAYKDGILIPAFNTAKLVNGKINLADVDVIAWVNSIKALSSAVQIVSKFGFLLASLIDTLMTFRKHRKSLTKRSFEE